LCRRNLRAILTDAQAASVLVTIDMENSAYVDRTLSLYRALRDEEHFTVVGTVIQSYLRRSQDDMAALAAEGAHIRLVKGAYLEPPDVAFPAKADVDAGYVALTKAYLSAPPPAYLCIATHDEQIIQAAETFTRDHAVARDRFEFQMLYGIRGARQDTLTQAGYTVRVYVPFGAAWYPYFMRRLAERPANVWFFARSFFRR
jgi:proline dehydrogenase